MAQPIKLAPGDRVSVNIQVDAGFMALCQEATHNHQYQGNVSEWARDALARALGYEGYNHYVRLVKEQE